MNRLRIVAAFAFLTFFGVMNLHNVVPHIHHTHEIKQQASHHHEHHGHTHNHGDENSDEKDLNDLLILLFGEHSFTFESHDSHIQWRQVQRLAKFIQLDIPKPSIEFINRKDDNYRHHLFKPNIYLQEHYSSNSLRAPPCLG